jgi:hypothetical protein
VRGKSSILWKKRSGAGDVVDYADDGETVAVLVNALHSPRKALIYHA